MAVNTPHPTAWVDFPTRQGLMEELREALGVVLEYGLAAGPPASPGQDPPHPQWD